MKRAVSVATLFVAAVISVAMTLSYFENNQDLNYIDRYEILYKEAGLNEPSGLALSSDGDALWTVSDDTKNVFKLTLDGRFLTEESFAVPYQGLEGIALEAAGEFLFMVDEDANAIIKVSVRTQQVAERRPLSDMAGYETVESHFAQSPPNKGLEGITWNADTGTIFVVKEGRPGLLIELSPDLRSIQGHIVLDDGNGFKDNDVFGDKLDFSGICYDPSRKQFWIVSDKGQRLFLYDRTRNEVTQTYSLSYRSKSGHNEVKKPEGVAIDPAANRIYVVSDKEVRLYLFEINERTAQKE